MKRRAKGFTLVEVMIVILIIAIILTIAVPNFITARTNSHRKSCIANLRKLDAAKEQWAMDNNAANGMAVTGGIGTLLGAGSYIKNATVECPAGGSYTLGNIGTDPTCTLAGLGHVL